jgi:ACDE family multidrug resistance protein
LESKYNIDGIPKGGVLAIPLLAMVTTSYFTGSKIKKKMGLMKWLIITGLLMLAGSLLPLIWINNLYFFLGLLLIGGIGTGLVLPCVNSMITGSIQKEERGMITSLYGSVRFFAVAFGPPIFSWLMSQSKVLMFGAISGLAVFGALMAYWLINPSKMKVPGASTNSHFHTHLGNKKARGKLKNS